MAAYVTINSGPGLETDWNPSKLRVAAIHTVIGKPHTCRPESCHTWNPMLHALYTHHTSKPHAALDLVQENAVAAHDFETPQA